LRKLFWFPKYGRDLTSTLPLRAKVAFDHSQSQSQYHMINECCYPLLSLSVCGAVGVRLVARQLCYLCCMCAVCSEMYFSLYLYFRRMQMPCKCVNSVDNFRYRCGEIILTTKKKWTVEYRNISSATRPLSLCEGVPIPETPEFFPTLWLLFLQWEIFQTKIVQKIKTQILCSIHIFWELCHLWDNVQTYHTTKRVTDDTTVRCMCTAFFIPTAIDTDSKHVILTALDVNGSYTNTP